jgi:Skp family chaperone for outer membrane proteins
MKNIKSLVAFALLLTSTISASANDYALINTYPLLNDMKMAKKQQVLLSTMKNTIADHKNNNKGKLAHLKNEFTLVINGLSKGDASLNLHGTTLVTLKNKIKTIQLVWAQEKNILDSAVNNKMYENEAYATINKISTDLRKLNNLYSKSYAKYKQNSIMKSLVRSYMNNNIATEPRYAFSTIR